MSKSIDWDWQQSLTPEEQAELAGLAQGIGVLADQQDELTRQQERLRNRQGEIQRAARSRAKKVGKIKPRWAL